MTAEKKELEIVLTPEIQAQMDADPELAKHMREFFANMRQADAAVQNGQYKTMEDAMEAIAGNRPVKIDPETGEEIHGASMSAEMGHFDDE